MSGVRVHLISTNFLVILLLNISRLLKKNLGVALKSDHIFSKSKIGSKIATGFRSIAFI